VRVSALLEVPLKVLAESGREDKGLQSVFDRIWRWLILQCRVVMILATTPSFGVIRIRSQILTGIGVM
jgi:hypothetical protein